MAPFHMHDFMSEDSGDFVGALRFFHQPGVKVNRSAGDGESVELGVFDDEETVVEGLRPHGGKNPLSDALDIAFNFGIIDEPKMFLGLAPKLSADSYLFVLARRTERGENRRKARAAATADEISKHQDPGTANLPRAKLSRSRSHREKYREPRAVNQ